MAKRVTDGERIINYVMTAPLAEVKVNLTTATAILKNREKSEGGGVAAAVPAVEHKTRKTRGSKASNGVPAPPAEAAVAVSADPAPAVGGPEGEF